MSFFYLKISESSDGKTWNVDDSLETLSASGTAATFESIDLEKITIGSLTTAESSEAVANSIHQIVSISQDADIGDGNTIGAAYFKTATGVAQTGRLATLMVRTSLSHNVFGAYGLQSHLSIDDDMSANAAGNLAAISGKLDINANTLGAGIAHAGLFIVDGSTSGAVSGDADVIWAHVESGVPASQVASVIRMSTGSTVNAGLRVSPTNMTNFIDFDAAAGCVSADPGSIPGTSSHKIKIDINGTAGYIPVVADY